MELADVIKLLRQMAKKLERWVEGRTKLTRCLTATLTGPLPPMDFERVLGFLQRNAQHAIGPIETHYNKLISCAKEIDELTADSRQSALETAYSRLDNLRYYAYRLANTLQDTADELEPQLPPEKSQGEFGFHPKEPSE